MGFLQSEVDTGCADCQLPLERAAWCCETTGMSTLTLVRTLAWHVVYRHLTLPAGLLLVGWKPRAVGVPERR